MINLSFHLARVERIPLERREATLKTLTEFARQVQLPGFSADTGLDITAVWYDLSRIQDDWPNMLTLRFISPDFRYDQEWRGSLAWTKGSHQLTGSFSITNRLTGLPPVRVNQMILVQEPDFLTALTELLREIMKRATFTLQVDSIHS